MGSIEKLCLMCQLNSTTCCHLVSQSAPVSFQQVVARATARAAPTRMLYSQPVLLSSDLYTCPRTSPFQEKKGDMRGCVLTAALCAGAASGVLAVSWFFCKRKVSAGLNQPDATRSVPAEEVASARPSSALLQLRALPSHFSSHLLQHLQQAGVEHVSTIAGSCEFRAFTNAEQQADTFAVPGLLLLAQLPPLDVPSQALPTPDEDGSYLRFLQSVHDAQAAQAAEQAHARLLRLIELLKEKDAPTSNERQNEGDQQPATNNKPQAPPATLQQPLFSEPQHQSVSPMAAAPPATQPPIAAAHGLQDWRGSLQPIYEYNVDPEDTFLVQTKTYRRVRSIATGGSCEVFEVIDNGRETFALKRVDLLEIDVSMARGCVQEIDMLRRLEHVPSIIKLQTSQVLQEQGLIFMVLELGKTNLASVLEKRDVTRRAAGQPYEALLTVINDESTIRLYWRQMLEAVCACHERRIVHRDLKPANFVFVGDELKLIDFGIAMNIAQDGDTIEGCAEGTVPYMAPEVLRLGWFNTKGIHCSELGRPSDVWSLGCILYEMAYGRGPYAHFRTEDDMSHAIRSRRHQVPFPPLANPQLLHAMKRCLDRDPEQRITVQELLAHPFLNPEAANTTGAGGLSGPYRPF